MSSAKERINVHDSDTSQERVNKTAKNEHVMRQALDAISNVLAGGDFDNPLCDLKQAALALQQAIAEAEKAENVEEKNT